MLVTDDDLGRLLLPIDDVYAGSAVNHDLPLHRIRRPAMVEVGERALMRFRPARAKPDVVGQHVMSAMAEPMPSESNARLTVKRNMSAA
jgi:hypothetical protein